MISGNVPEHLKSTAVAMQSKIDGMSQDQCAGLCKTVGIDTSGMNHADMQMALKKHVMSADTYQQMADAMQANMSMREKFTQAFADFMSMFDLADSGLASDYLVVEDPKQSSTWHLRVRQNGKPDHTLMGAAWAALHEGYRGNKYEGPNKTEAISKLTALYKSEKMPIPGSQANASMEDIFFTDISDFEHISQIDGLPATGDKALIDMHGREIKISPEDLPQYITNTQAVLESTKDSSGNIVGLPIDMNGHDHEGGAGWLVGLELDATRNIIKFAINWTQAGIDLVKGNIRRFFSATFDPNKKIILGGSMTNKPATRNSNYEYMLSPVELSETLKELDMTTLQEEFEALKATVTALVAGKPKEEKKEEGDSVSLTADENDKLAELAEQRAKKMLREARSKDEVVSFVAELAGGTNNRPIGFSVPTKKLTNFLLRQNEADRKEFQGYLTMFSQAAIIDFSEHGISGEGYIFRPKLPAEYVESLNLWIEGGKDIASYFQQIAPELKMEDFNLSEYMKPEEK